MSINSLAPIQTEAFITPVAFQALYEKELIVAPNPEHIARTGQIIGEELPDYALPAAVEEVAIIIRGSTKKNDAAKLLERDVNWLKAAPSQPYFPADGLKSPDIRGVQPTTKSAIAQAGRFVMEFSCVNPGLWDLRTPQGSGRPIEFALQWVARRKLPSNIQNIPHEFKGALSSFPIFGSKDRKVRRILDIVTEENLDPFYVTKRRPALPPIN